MAGGDPKKQSIKDTEIGEGTIIWDFVNIFGAKIGKNCKVGAFVEIQSDVEIGDNTRVSSHSFLCSKMRVGKDVFIGHGVMFASDLYPPQEYEFWRPIVVGDGASIGTNATILCERIGENAIIGAGAVVTKDVPANTIVVGNPARVLRTFDPQKKLSGR
jgi:acetyltransferase-like isoleucine patch superfamily enzyme